MSVKRILVPTDFSECSKSALSFAMALARGGNGAEITLLHVVPTSIPTFDDDLGVLEPERLRTEMHALAASKTGGLDIDAHIEHGEPAATILEYSLTHKFDLIVMGTHGQGGLLRKLVGGTTEAVMRRAACPVLVVRDDSVISADSTTAD